ncbi:MAG TPA: TIR-like protein FxsC [Longimicrobium sp.]|nr:TIR-like protein FxsC [Longimicrobium sp.]
MSVFFFSYAREDHDQYLERFYEELSEEVRVRTGQNPPGFIDQQRIQVGEQWTQALFEALQTSRVLVAIYSPTYFGRPTCGREWGVFNLRQQAYREQFKRPDYTPPVILPVLWAPEENVEPVLPAITSAVQYKHADFGETYATEGLRVLMRQSRHRDRRRAFIEALAEKIVDAARIPVPRAPVQWDEVPNVFRPAVPPPAGARVGPMYVKFVYVAATRAEWEAARLKAERGGYEGSALEWHPYHPEVQEAVALMAQEVTTSRRMLYQDIPFDAASASTLVQALEEAERNGNIIVMIVDPWTLRLEGYFASMLACDRASQCVQYVVACPWNPAQEPEPDRVTLENAVRSAFPLRLENKPDYILNPIPSAPDLKDRLADALELLRKLRIQAQQPEDGGSALPLVSPN